jgi:hypothetical protein
VSSSHLAASEEALILALREIRFGSIEAVIHDGRIVHFERREKVRFAEPHTAHPTAGGSIPDTFRVATPVHRIDAGVSGGDSPCGPASRKNGERLR